jgi:uncharacterized protein YqjF (DUF2071 family)
VRIRNLHGPGDPFYEKKNNVEPAAPGSLEYFLAERYILYSLNRGRLFTGRVHHSPYPLQHAEVARIDENLLSSSKIIRTDSTPLAHFASGVVVDVFPLQDCVARPLLDP